MSCDTWKASYRSDKAMYMLNPSPTSPAPTLLLVAEETVSTVEDDDSVVDVDSLDDEDEDSSVASDTVSEMVDTSPSASDGDTRVASMKSCSVPAFPSTVTEHSLFPSQEHERSSPPYDMTAVDPSSQNTQISTPSFVVDCPFGGQAANAVASKALKQSKRTDLDDKPMICFCSFYPMESFIKLPDDYKCRARH